MVAFSSADTLALGGSTNASFNVSQIGAAAQYQGFGVFLKTGSSTWTLTGSTTAVTPWMINQGTLVVSADNNLGAASGGLSFGGGTLQFLAGFTSNRGVTLNAGGGTFDTDGNNVTLSGVIANGNGAGALTVASTVAGGVLTLTNTNTYTGATTINGGTLAVNGSIATSSLTSVNNNGTLIGTGTVGNAQIASGGTFAPGAAGTPGTFMTVSGNLAFASGAIYLVQVNPATASLANVTGTASLAGNVLAAFAAGSYVTKQYTILTSSGLGGSKFAALGTANLPAGFNTTLSYSTTDAFLNLNAVLGGPGSGLGGNQQNVANSLNNFFNSGGALTPNFLTIFGLTGGNLAAALSQLSGEATTAGEQAAFQMMTNFLGLTIDPGAGAGGGGGTAGGATGFAPEEEASLPPDIALAYASILKAPVPSQPSPASGGGSGWGFDQRWSAWGSSFGGYNKTNGDPSAGTNTVTASVFGFAGGMDYHVTPNTTLGFALAGAGSNWSLAQNLGGGRSDSFQVGVDGRTHFGPAYLAASLAFANHWMTTNRIAPLGDQLTAAFDAQSYGGRLETGYRYAVQPLAGVTPYAALQTQWFHTPGYSETDLSGGGFGLSYSAMTANDTRSELGARVDDLTTFDGMPLILRARAAWAHDWVSTPSLLATFQTLPGANFIVNDAAIPANSALTTASAELRLTAAWSVLAQFDGDFASTSQTYAGTGTLRYIW